LKLEISQLQLEKSSVATPITSGNIISVATPLATINISTAIAIATEKTLVATPLRTREKT
jgi:hypothetical protein